MGSKFNGNGISNQQCMLLICLIVWIIIFLMYVTDNMGVTFGPGKDSAFGFVHNGKKYECVQEEGFASDSTYRCSPEEER